MKNILMLFLTIGLLSSLSSCGDENDETGDPECWTIEMRYVNNTGAKPVTVDYFRQIYDYAEDKYATKAISVKFWSEDTTIVSEMAYSPLLLPPNGNAYDSAHVTIGSNIKRFYKSDSAGEVGNPCNANCYQYQDVTSTRKKYTFIVEK